MAAKQFSLTNKQQFWKVSIEGNITRISYGKIGNKGRLCQPKTHKDRGAAIKFARNQANSKIMQGFSEIVTKRRNSLQRPPTQRQLSVTKLAKKPPKKRESIRKLSRQSTIQLPPELDVNVDARSKKTPSTLKWKKPPKKQSTVRRRAALADEISFIEESVKVAFGAKKGLTRQSSMRRKLFMQKSNK